MVLFGGREFAGAAMVAAAWWLVAVATSGGEPTLGRSMGDSAAVPGAPVVRLETDRTSYAPGDTIRAQLTVSHGAGPAVTLEFGTAQRCDFEIRDAAGATLWRWSADRAFAQMVGEETLAAGRPPYVCGEGVPAPQASGRYRVVGSLVAIDRHLSAEAIVTVATAIRRP